MREGQEGRGRGLASVQVVLDHNESRSPHQTGDVWFLSANVGLLWWISSDQLDIGAARRLLDEDHYALDKLKRRVLEYLAVRQLKTSLKVPSWSIRTCCWSPSEIPSVSSGAHPVLRGAPGGGQDQRGALHRQDPWEGVPPHRFGGRL